MHFVQFYSYCWRGREGIGNVHSIRLHISRWKREKILNMHFIRPHSSRQRREEITNTHSIRFYSSRRRREQTVNLDSIRLYSSKRRREKPEKTATYPRGLATKHACCRVRVTRAYTYFYSELCYLISSRLHRNTKHLHNLTQTLLGMLRCLSVLRV